MILSLRLHCMTCGALDSALSTDPPKKRQPPNWRSGPWTRWAEMDRAAEKHSGKGGHPTQLSAGRA